MFKVTLRRVPWREGRQRSLGAENGHHSEHDLGKWLIKSFQNATGLPQTLEHQH